jgi:hypothetical protein
LHAHSFSFPHPFSVTFCYPFIYPYVISIA